MLRGQVTKKYKKNAAMAFVKGRLGELRAEERRRVSFHLLCIYEKNLYVMHNKVFGVTPYQLSTNMKCDSFVEKFLPVLKVDSDSIPTTICM